MPAHLIYRFGAFELDPANRQLTAGPESVCLTDPQSALLLQLVASAPDVVDKDALARAGWGGMAVSDNSVEQAISCLRRALSQDADQSFIETVRHRGYRFVAAIQRLDRPDDALAAHAGLDAYDAFRQGGRELATLRRDALPDACRAFEQTIAHDGMHASAHAALGMTCALMFEASRVDAACDLEALQRAVHHTRRATTIDAARADGWSSLGFALYLEGDTDAAGAAGRKAVALERDGWRHWLRLAYVSWGEERIEAAQAALALHPKLALAYWLKATVLIARSAFDAALFPIAAGCAAQDEQRINPGPYPAVGLHLLHGLVLAAQDRLDEAMREFECELGEPDHGQLYARECAANTWYARGAVHLRRAEHDAAMMSFKHALDIAPAHYFSMAALGLPIPTLSSSDPRAGDVVIARATTLTREGRHRDAAKVYRGLITSGPPANAGWMLPVEPLLHVSAHPDIWNDALTIVRQRAS